MTEATRSVRLECVMHAASVNPEPGSNSLKNCIFSHSRELIPFSELFILASLLLVLFSKCFNEISALFSARNFMLFNFQGAILARFPKRAQLLYIILFVLSIEFPKYFSFFSKSVRLHKNPDEKISFEYINS